METDFSGIALLIGIIGVAYLLGSVPYGLLFSKAFCGLDPRTAGSGNVGATNVARLCGKKWGFLTLACDLGKGALAVGIGMLAVRFIAGTPVYAPLFAGFAAIMGHVYSFWLHFKGGKGVATTVGVFLTLTPGPFIIAAVLCLAIIWRSGFVSAGSLVLALSLPPLVYLFGYKAEVILALVIALFVVYSHRENIDRLRKGQEKPWNVKTNAPETSQQ